MNVFGVGPVELIVVLVVALIFVGPERLPKLAADLARTIRDIRRYTGGIAAEFGEVIKEFEKDTETERTEWKEIGRGLSEATGSVTKELEAARSDAESPATAPTNGHAPTAAPAAIPQPGKLTSEPTSTAVPEERR